MIRCRKRGTKTIVQFWDRVEEENLYRRVRFEADVERRASIPWSSAWSHSP